MKLLLAGLVLFATISNAAAMTQSQTSCQTVRLGMMEWTDLQIVNSIADLLLSDLGYDVKVVDASRIDEVYERMQKKEVDVFMGNWFPTMLPLIGPYLDGGSMKIVNTNLDEALYTLAVPHYVYEQGVQSFADIARFKERFGGRIYGLEKGNDGNQLVQQMIDSNDFNLGGFNLIETSERLMLAQVKGKIRKGEWIAFLAWKPHPMNQNFDIDYLSGGDAYFGPNMGKSLVKTSVSTSFNQSCKNLAQFFSNLSFPIEMEESLMDLVINRFVEPKRAAQIWLHENPEYISQWLNGVRSAQGHEPDAHGIAQRLKVTMGR